MTVLIHLKQATDQAERIYMHDLHLLIGWFAVPLAKYQLEVKEQDSDPLYSEHENKMSIVQIFKLVRLQCVQHNSALFSSD